MLLSLGCSLFLLLCVVPAVRGDSFEQFTTTGQFLNDPHVALTGGFIVDNTTGQVVSIDVFHGLTELTLLGITGPDPGVPDDFLIVAHDPAGDSMNLVLYAPGNGGSLQGYAGGPICTTLNAQPLCGGFASNFIFLADLPDFEKAIDDVWFGSVTDSGPAQVPESSVFVFLGTGAAVLFLGRRRRFAVSF